MDKRKLSAEEIAAYETFAGPLPGFAVEIILTAAQLDIAERIGGGDVRVGIQRALDSFPSQEAAAKILGILPDQSFFDNFPLETIAELLKGVNPP